MSTGIWNMFDRFYEVLKSAISDVLTSQLNPCNVERTL